MLGADGRIMEARKPPRAAGIVHTAYEGRREAAFRERRKMHDIVLGGNRLTLGKRGHRQ
jgi:hypothetical protein